MLRSSTLFGGLLGLLLFAGPAFAQGQFVASLSGANEVPPVTTVATGTVIGSLDGTSLVVTGTFSGLESAYAASHIHQAAAGTNGGVVVALSPTVDGDGFGGVFEAASNTFTLTPEQVIALEDDEFYVNIHTTTNGGGEIRGQLIEADTKIGITGLFDGPLTGGIPKGVELFVAFDVPDLSVYGIGSANNGGGTDGVEFVLSGSATAGQFLYIATEEAEFTNFFGFAPDFVTGNLGAAAINGDDAVELFYAPGLTVEGPGAVVDTFGDINVDGNGEPWEYLDGWAYRVSGTAPEGVNFVLADWTFSGVNGLEGGTTNATTNVPFPIGSYVLDVSDGATLSFTSATGSGDEGTTFDIVATLTFPGGSPNGLPVTIGVVFDGASSSADAADFTGPTPATGTFTGNTDGEEITFSVALAAADGVEGEEEAVFDLTLNSGAASAGNAVSFALTINDTDVPPMSTIAEARALGVGSNVMVTGVVSRARGAFTYIQDATGGLTVRQTSGAWFDAVANGLIVPGRPATVIGTLSAFRELLQINGGDMSNFTLGAVGDVPTAQVVTLAELEANGENYEAELVQVNAITITGTGDFAAGTSYPIADASSATNAVVLRTPSAADTQIPGTSIPTDGANVSAVVGQFSTADPAAGYQLLIIDSGDVEMAVGSEESGSENAFALESVSPNPAAGSFVVTFSVATPGAVRLSVVDVLGREVAVIANGEMEARQHTVRVSDEDLAPGTYLLRLESNGSVASRTMTVVR